MNFPRRFGTVRWTIRAQRRGGNAQSEGSDRQRCCLFLKIRHGKMCILKQSFYLQLNNHGWGVCRLNPPSVRPYNPASAGPARPYKYRPTYRSSVVQRKHRPPASGWINEMPKLPCASPPPSSSGCQLVGSGRAIAQRAREIRTSTENKTLLYVTFNLEIGQEKETPHYFYTYKYMHAHPNQCALKHDQHRSSLPCLV